MATADKISYDVPTAQVTEDDIESIVNQIQRLIADRERQANQALAHFKMTHADDEYRHVEQRWNRASQETKQIVALVRATIGKNSHRAGQLVAETRAAIGGIG